LDFSAEKFIVIRILSTLIVIDHLQAITRLI
jgi:hypothetical protein